MYIRFLRKGHPEDAVLTLEEYDECSRQAKIVLMLWSLGDAAHRSFKMAPHGPRTCCAAAQAWMSNPHRDLSELDHIAREHRLELRISRTPVEGFLDLAGSR